MQREWSNDFPNFQFSIFDYFHHHQKNSLCKITIGLMIDGDGQQDHIAVHRVVTATVVVVVVVGAVAIDVTIPVPDHVHVLVPGKIKNLTSAKNF